MRPNSAIAAFTSCSSWSVTVTSVGTTSARRPRSRTTAAVASRSASVRAASTTSAPASARPIAHPAPMPLPAPVTSATRPSRRNRSRITAGACNAGGARSQSRRRQLSGNAGRISCSKCSSVLVPNSVPAHPPMNTPATTPTPAAISAGGTSAVPGIAQRQQHHRGPNGREHQRADDGADHAVAQHRVLGVRPLDLTGIGVVDPRRTRGGVVGDLGRRGSTRPLRSVVQGRSRSGSVSWSCVH